MFHERYCYTRRNQIDLHLVRGRLFPMGGYSVITAEGFIRKCKKMPVCASGH